MSYTFLDNAAPEHPRDTSRRISPILTPDGKPRVRVEFGRARGLHSDYFPNAARDVAAALVAHANEAEQMAANLANEKARAEAAKRKAEAEAAEAKRKAEAEAKAKPHPRAVRPSPVDHPHFWIWCDDGGTFQYMYTNYGRIASSFIPGVSFVAERGRFDPSPENVALWIKLAAEAAYEDARSW